MKPKCYSGYLTSALSNPQEIVEWIVEQTEYIDFDTIVFRGMSGALIAPIVAYKLKKALLMVRKDHDNDNHSERKFEGNVNLVNFIVIDDLISCGGTMKSIFDHVYHNVVTHCLREITLVPECKRIFLYRQQGWRESWDYNDKVIPVSNRHI